MPEQRDKKSIKMKIITAILIGTLFLGSSLATTHLASLIRSISRKPTPKKAAIEPQAPPPIDAPYDKDLVPENCKKLLGINGLDLYLKGFERTSSANLIDKLMNNQFAGLDVWELVHLLKDLEAVLKESPEEETKATTELLIEKTRNAFLHKAGTTQPVLEVLKLAMNDQISVIHGNYHNLLRWQPGKRGLIRSALENIGNSLEALTAAFYALPANERAIVKKIYSATLRLSVCAVNPELRSVQCDLSGSEFEGIGNFLKYVQDNSQYIKKTNNSRS